MHNKLRMATPSPERIRGSSEHHARARARASPSEMFISVWRGGGGEGNSFRNNLDEDPIAIISFRNITCARKTDRISARQLTERDCLFERACGLRPLGLGHRQPFRLAFLLSRSLVAPPRGYFAYTTTTCTYNQLKIGRGRPCTPHENSKRRSDKMDFRSDVHYGIIAGALRTLSSTSGRRRRRRHR